MDNSTLVPTAPPRYPAPPHGVATPHIVAIVVALVALQQVYTAAVGSTAPTLLQAWLPGDIVEGGRLVATLAGLGLLVVASGLGRRRREAWAWACAGLGVSAVASLTVTHQGRTVVGALAALALLMALHPQFTAVAAAAQVRRRHAAGVGALALAALYALAGQVVVGGSLAPQPTPGHVLDAVVPLFLSADLPYRTLTPQAAWFVSSVPLVGGAALLYALLAALRPAVMRVRLQGEQARAARLLDQWGRGALSPFVLADDKIYCWGPDGAGVLAYATAGGVAMVCGEPVAATPQARLALLGQFSASCRRRGQTPALYQASAEFLPGTRGLGFSALKIGEEVILDLSEFSLQGKRRANARHSATHAERAGLSVRFFDAGVDDDTILGQLTTLSAAWVRGHRLKELRFSMNGFNAARLRTQRTAVAVDDAGYVHAFITLLPTYADGGMALDLMRRAPEAIPGAMELLLARAAARLGAQGYTSFSLGLAPLAGVDTPDNGRAGKGLAFLVQRLDGIYHYRSLQRFKDKFAPRWEDRFLLYPGPAAVPSVLYALARVHVGGPAPAGEPQDKPGHLARRDGRP